jgi:hypothetical protein
MIAERAQILRDGANESRARSPSRGRPPLHSFAHAPATACYPLRTSTPRASSPMAEGRVASERTSVGALRRSHISARRGRMPSIVLHRGRRLRCNRSVLSRLDDLGRGNRTRIPRVRRCRRWGLRLFRLDVR